MLRDAASEWVRANCPHPDVIADFLDQFDQAASGSANCSFTFGQRLTKSGHAYLMYCVSGELFTFQLTPRQVAKLKNPENILTTTVCGHPEAWGPVPNPSFCLDEMDIDSWDRFSTAEPTRGVVWYHQLPNQRSVPRAARLDVILPGGASIIQWYYMDRAFHPEGSFPVQFPPLHSTDLPALERLSGPLALFLRVVTDAERSQPSGGRPISNILAKLVDVV